MSDLTPEALDRLAANACDTCGTDLPPDAGAFCSRCALDFHLDQRDERDEAEMREWMRGAWT